MKAANQSTGRLPGDTCDREWIWDREVETEDHAQALARGEAAWERQWRHLMENSDFYRRRFGDAGVGSGAGGGMRNRAIGIADRRQRAAQMAMAVGPIRRVREQPFIGGGRLFMAAAITKQPRTEMGRLRVVRGHGKGGGSRLRRCHCVRMTTDALAPRPTVWASATRAPCTCRGPAAPRS